MEGGRSPLAKNKIGLELLELLGSPQVASRRLLYRTYDQMVGTDTVVGPGGDAAVLRIKGRGDGIALAVDAQPRLAALDPFAGAAAAVAEATRNLVCVGAEPVGISDCLNLGNPERPEGAWQLERTVAGIAAACEALGVPVVSGNVSLYNATAGVDIWPTAVVGAVGHLPDVTRHLRATSGRAGDLVLLAGSARVSLAASVYGAIAEVEAYADGGADAFAGAGAAAAGASIALDLSLEARLQRFVLGAHARGLLRAAHDRADGGLGVALAEIALRDGLGMKVTLPAVVASRPGAPTPGIDKRVALFGEGPSGIVLIVDPARAEEVHAIAARYDVPLWTLGTVGGDLLEVAPVLGTPIASLRRAYEEGLPRALGREP